MGAVFLPYRELLRTVRLVPALIASGSLIPSQVFSTIIFCTLSSKCGNEIPVATTTGYTSTAVTKWLDWIH